MDLAIALWIWVLGWMAYNLTHEISLVWNPLIENFFVRVDRAHAIRVLQAQTGRRFAPTDPKVAKTIRVWRLLQALVMLVMWPLGAGLTFWRLIRGTYNTQPLVMSVCLHTDEGTARAITSRMMVWFRDVSPDHPFVPWHIRCTKDGATFVVRWSVHLSGARMIPREQVISAAINDMRGLMAEMGADPSWCEITPAL